MEKKRFEPEELGFRNLGRDLPPDGNRWKYERTKLDNRKQ